MRIIEDDTVTLKRVRFRFERSRICINGRRTWFTVDGITLEKAIQINSRYLLFVSHKEEKEHWISDCNIYLINPSGRVLEDRSIDAVNKYDPSMGYAADNLIWDDYQTEYCGYLRDFTLIPPNIITFQFRNTIYSIKVFEKPIHPWSHYFSKKGVQRNENNFGFFAGESILPLVRSRLQINIIKELDISNNTDT